jgi:hypothetical protein
MKNEKIVLACARADDCPVVPPGSTYKHHCHKCKAVLVVAPTGQRALKNHPSARLLCLQCLPGGLPPGVLAASLDEVLDEMRRAVPNLWGQRN